MTKGRLVLEDGSTFEGVSAGASGTRIGEVIKNTAVVGYQEMMTDPANAGKILVLTYPLIGNYGAAEKFYESSRCWVEALVIKEKSAMHSNWQAEDSFDGFIRKEKVPVITEMDTRTLAVRIRDRGQMLGIISTRAEKKTDLLKKLKEYKKNGKNNFIRRISTKKVIEIKGKPGAPKIVVLDLGIVNSLITQLKMLECGIVLLPFRTPADVILKMKPDGLIISGGPEEDTAVPGIVETVKAVIGRIPLLGISLGHEIIGLACGGRLRKLKAGHHGVNYPVRPPSSFKGEITVQNHSWVVDENSIKKQRDVTVTLRNVNDDTIEEMESRKLKFISAQYCPAIPGPGEINNMLVRFLSIMKNRGN